MQRTVSYVSIDEHKKCIRYSYLLKWISTSQLTHGYRPWSAYWIVTKHTHLIKHQSATLIRCLNWWGPRRYNYCTIRQDMTQGRISRYCQSGRCLLHSRSLQLLPTFFPPPCSLLCKQSMIATMAGMENMSNECPHQILVEHQTGNSRTEPEP